MPPAFGLFWDVDGTMAETEGDGHRRAFNAAFAERGLPWRWSMDDYGQLLRITGGEERLRHWLATDPPGARGSSRATAADCGPSSVCYSQIRLDKPS